MRRKSSVQIAMFGAGEDLPLFSGTAQRAPAPQIEPEPLGKQEPLACTCRLCHDTGKVKFGATARFCTCDVGRELWWRWTSTCSSLWQIRCARTWRSA
jgi:hypothetical protein